MSVKNVNLQPGQIYSPPEVAEMLGISVQSLLRLLRARKIHAAKILGHWRIQGDVILEIFNQGMIIDFSTPKKPCQ